MNITTKIIITDTNIITDLSNANVLDKFVKLDNVYISDMVKRDEINSNTGNVNIIKKFKTINATSEEIDEIFKISGEVHGLSPYDIINFIIARDNNAILATGDKKLKNYSEANGVEVIRTLKIIRLMRDKHIITNKEAINVCKALKENNNTRIPPSEIDNIIKEFEKESVTCWVLFVIKYYFGKHLTIIE